MHRRLLETNAKPFEMIQMPVNQIEKSSQTKCQIKAKSKINIRITNGIQKYKNHKGQGIS